MHTPLSVHERSACVASTLIGPVTLFRPIRMLGTRARYVRGPIVAYVYPTLINRRRRHAVHFVFHITLNIAHVHLRTTIVQRRRVGRLVEYVLW